MTENDMRIATAEECGWKWYRRPATGPWAAKPMRSLYHPTLHAEYVATLAPADMTERQCNEVFIWREGMVPDYPNSFDAMHDAWLTLTTAQRMKFSYQLHRILERDSKDEMTVWRFSVECFKATAHQLDEAFLCAIEKWRDS